MPHSILMNRTTKNAKPHGQQLIHYYSAEAGASAVQLSPAHKQQSLASQSAAAAALAAASLSYTCA